QNIGTPRSTAFGLQQPFMRRAELAQAAVTGENNFILWGARRARIARHGLGHKAAVDLSVCPWLASLEERMVEKLPRSPRQHETAMRVGRPGFAFAKCRSPSCRVKAVFPDQFVREREAIALEFETTRAERRIYSASPFNF